jgi:hypothetical protein
MGSELLIVAWSPRPLQTIKTVRGRSEALDAEPARLYDTGHADDVSVYYHR